MVVGVGWYVVGAGRTRDWDSPTEPPVLEGAADMRRLAGEREPTAGVPETTAAAGDRVGPPAQRDLRHRAWGVRDQENGGLLEASGRRRERHAEGAAVPRAHDLPRAVVVRDRERLWCPRDHQQLLNLKVEVAVVGDVDGPELDEEPILTAP